MQGNAGIARGLMVESGSGVPDLVVRRLIEETAEHFFTSPPGSLFRTSIDRHVDGVFAD